MSLLRDSMHGDSVLLAEIIDAARANPKGTIFVLSWFQHVLADSGFSDELAVLILGQLIRYEDPVRVRMLDLAATLNSGPEKIRESLRLLEKHGLVAVDEVASTQCGAEYQVQIHRENLVAITYNLPVPENVEDEPEDD